MEVTVYGRSDDLIEIDGDISDEFDAYKGWRRVEFNDGTVLRVGYSVEKDKGWSVKLEHLADGAEINAEEPDMEDGEHYSDRVRVSGRFTKVRVCGDSPFNRSEVIDQLGDFDWYGVDNEMLAKVRDMVTGWTN